MLQGGESGPRTPVYLAEERGGGVFEGWERREGRGSRGWKREKERGRGRIGGQDRNKT